MKKNILIIFFIILIIVAVVWFIFFYNKNNVKNKSENYEANRTSTNVNTTTENTNTENKAQNNTTNTTENNSTKPEENKINITENATGKEEEISSFSTKIVTKDDNRQHNITLTCTTLNDTIVENGSTFSFCSTVGQATSAKGYKEADIFDANGKKKKGLGGGNCQISTTLYNAVLKVSSLSVVERHKHSNYVPYIKEGKDAAVAYGSYDFKFKNNTGNNIKIKAEATPNDITIKLLKIS
jgi:vancomycin resistance protein YoaR